MSHYSNGGYQSMPEDYPPHSSTSGPHSVEMAEIKIPRPKVDPDSSFYNSVDSYTHYSPDPTEKRNPPAVAPKPKIFSKPAEPQLEEVRLTDTDKSALILATGGKSTLDDPLLESRPPTPHPTKKSIKAKVILLIIFGILLAIGIALGIYFGLNPPGKTTTTSTTTTKTTPPPTTTTTQIPVILRSAVIAFTDEKTPWIEDYSNSSSTAYKKLQDQYVKSLTDLINGGDNYVETVVVTGFSSASKPTREDLVTHVSSQVIFKSNSTLTLDEVRSRISVNYTNPIITDTSSTTHPSDGSTSSTNPITTTTYLSSKTTTTTTPTPTTTTTTTKPVILRSADIDFTDINTPWMPVYSNSSSDAYKKLQDQYVKSLTDMINGEDDYVETVVVTGFSSASKPTREDLVTHVSSQVIFKSNSTLTLDEVRSRISVNYTNPIITDTSTENSTTTIHPSDGSTSSANPISTTTPLTSTTTTESTSTSYSSTTTTPSVISDSTVTSESQPTSSSSITSTTTETLVATTTESPVSSSTDNPASITSGFPDSSSTDNPTLTSSGSPVSSSTDNPASTSSGSPMTDTSPESSSEPKTTESSTVSISTTTEVTTEIPTTSLTTTTLLTSTAETGSTTASVTATTTPTTTTTITTASSSDEPTPETSVSDVISTSSTTTSEPTTIIDTTTQTSSDTSMTSTIATS